MGLHLKYSAVRKDAVATKYPETLWAAPKDECLPVKGQLYMVSMSSEAKNDPQKV